MHDKPNLCKGLTFSGEARAQQFRKIPVAIFGLRVSTQVNDNGHVWACYMLV